MDQLPKAMDLTNQRVRKGRTTKGLERLVNRAKSQVRARVEHVFGVVKRLWGVDKVRFRGLAKITLRARSSPLGWPTSTWREARCVNKSVRKRRKAGQWLAKQPERACGAVRSITQQKCGRALHRVRIQQFC